jgi:t-SNARE complex subunit (syntaxin)
MRREERHGAQRRRRGAVDGPHYFVTPSLAVARVQKMLDQMKSETSKLMEEPDSEEDVRIRETGHMSLARRYVQAMKAHQAQKQAFTKQSKDTILRRAKIVFDDMPEEEIQRRVQENPTNFMREAIMTYASEEAVSAYNEATQRAQDVEMLERSVMEVYRMFVDLANLVDQQSEMLDNIAVNVDRVANYVEKGNVELQAAIEYKRKERCVAPLICARVCVCARVAELTVRPPPAAASAAAANAGAVFSSFW